MEKEFITLAEASEILGVHKNTLRRYIKTGVLKAYKSPSSIDGLNKIYLKREDIDNFFKPIDKSDLKMIVYD